MLICAELPNKGPACVLASNAAESEPKMAFSARFSVAQQVTVHAGLGGYFLQINRHIQLFG